MGGAAHYPAFLNLDGKRVLLVGGGGVAARKAGALARCGARVKVVAPRVCPAARRRAEVVVERVFSPRDLDGVALAVCATDDEALNARVSRLCRRRGIWANVVDRPGLCDFIVPAVVRRGTLSIAVSTGGASPFMARRLRRRINSLLTPEDARLAAALKKLRPRLLEVAISRRRRVLAAVAAAGALGAAREIQSFSVTQEGLVSIVGAGPGDPGLLTLKGAERLRAAQAVVHDALVSPGILAMAPASAEIFDAGKRDCRHTMPQAEINRLLTVLSRRGLRVVRLKGGDPFLFGRGGEEAEALALAGLPWEVVPGVSSCLAAPAYAGIPVTDRRFSSMVTVVTGHACERDADGPGVDWARISPQGTLVVLMGLSSLPDLCARLIGLGWPRTTPAAALSAMGWREEAVVESDLESLPGAVRAAGLTAPAVIVAGDVVSMRRRLSWRAGIAAVAAGRG